jgi:hypothetical protein
MSSDMSSLPFSGRSIIPCALISRGDVEIALRLVVERRLLFATERAEVPLLADMFLSVHPTARSGRIGPVLRDETSPRRIQRSAKRLDRLLHRASRNFEQPAIGLVQFENEEYRAADGEGSKGKGGESRDVQPRENSEPAEQQNRP